ncbi:hypothetical protein ACQP2Y_27905 [Actinoplanes sp. CA-051413]|uniref:hypothetical protein n=1 Tax=Actinoplanes sp. CA-051413 TaxID=3239899 RepID=UPI003D99A860
MSDVNVREMLETYAAAAPAPPPDLLERVEAGHRRRRRRRRAGSAAVVLVLVAVAVGAAIGPWPGRRAAPDQTAGQPALLVPASFDDGPQIASVWPRAIIDEPPVTSPTGKKASVVGRLDADRVLVRDPVSFYSYNVRDKTFKTLVTGYGGNDTANEVLITPNWLVWQVRNHGEEFFSVYRAPVTGGERQLVVTVQTSYLLARDWYATDEAVYWSARTGGVTRVSLSDGVMTTPAELQRLGTHGTAWAELTGRPAGRSSGTVSRLLRNLVTGEERTVTALPDTVSLRCAPTFCLGRTEVAEPSAPRGTMREISGWFVQELDGSGRRALPPVSDPGGARLVPTDTGGRLLIWTKRVDQIVLNPVTGRWGSTRTGTGRSPSCATAGQDAFVWGGDKPPVNCNTGQGARMMLFEDAE